MTGLGPVAHVFKMAGHPLWVAGLVEAAVRRAARIGDLRLIANATMLGATAPLMMIYRATLAFFVKMAAEFPITRECYGIKFDGKICPISHRMLIWWADSPDEPDVSGRVVPLPRPDRCELSVGAQKT